MSTVLEHLEDVDANRERFVMGGPRAIVPLLHDAAEEIRTLESVVYKMSAGHADILVLKEALTEKEFEVVTGILDRREP